VAADPTTGSRNYRTAGRTPDAAVRGVRRLDGSRAAIAEMSGSVCGRTAPIQGEWQVVLLLDTGARSGEFAGLRLADVDVDLDVLLVLGKGRRERALPSGRTAALALDRYLRARVRHPQAHLEWLWLGKKGGLTASGLAQMLERRGNQAGLPGLYPHRLRHTFAHSGWPKVVVNGPDAPGWLEVPRDAAALRRLGCRCPGSRGTSPSLARGPAEARSPAAAESVGPVTTAESFR
jgi:Phage integrase family